jgi:fungal STAND N-terminal Goodbye domain
MRTESGFSTLPHVAVSADSRLFIYCISLEFFARSAFPIILQHLNIQPYPRLMGLITSTTTPPSNFRLIIDAALDEYTKQTGIDLTQNPFARRIQQSDSPDHVMKLFQEREKEFKEYRNQNRKLINLLKPAVQVLHALSGTLGEAVSLVSCLSFLPS